MTPGNPTADDFGQLAALLGEQLIQYQAVLDLSRQQNQAIAAGDTAGLMAILARKQQHIGEIDRLGTRAGPLRERWEERRESLPPERRRPVEEAVRQLREVLAQIVALEDQGQNSLRSGQQQTGQQIVKLQQGKALHKAYGGGKQLPPSARFQDRQG